MRSYRRRSQDTSRDACLEKGPTRRALSNLLCFPTLARGLYRPAGSRHSSAEEDGQILVVGMTCFAQSFTAFQESLSGEQDRTVRRGLVVDLAVLGLRLDSMILKVFSNLNDSMTLWSKGAGQGVCHLLSSGCCGKAKPPLSLSVTCSSRCFGDR